jgi:hypothetical protein
MTATPTAKADPTPEPTIEETTPEESADSGTFEGGFYCSGWFTAQAAYELAPSNKPQDPNAR